MPSGEVMASGDGALPLSWADAQPQLSNIAASAGIIERVIAAFSSFTLLWAHDAIPARA
jgi:hypothetical protein